MSKQLSQVKPIESSQVKTIESSQVKPIQTSQVKTSESSQVKTSESSQVITNKLISNPLCIQLDLILNCLSILDFAYLKKVFEFMNLSQALSQHDRLVERVSEHVLQNGEGQFRLREIAGIAKSDTATLLG